MPTGQAIMRQAGIILNDADHIRWPLTELCEWINAAVRDIVAAKPSASPMSFPVQLRRGTRQTVPTTGTPKPLQLIDITRNLKTMDADNRVGLRAVKATGKAILDACDPNWHDERARRYDRTVRSFFYDENNPTEWFCYPGNDGTGIVEAIMSVLPDALAATDDTAVEASYAGEIGLGDLYQNAVLEYVLYKAESKDDIASDSGRAMGHYQLFAQAIGIKTQIEAATSPNARRGSK